MSIVDANNNPLMQFSGSTIMIGKSDNANVEIDSNSFELKDSDNNTFFFVGDTRDSNGRADVTQQFVGNGTKKQFVVNKNVYSVTSVKINGSTTTSYSRSQKIFTFNTAPTDGAIILISYKTNEGVYRFDLGERISNSRIGINSIIIGSYAEASGDESIAEGLSTSSGYCSHSEGTSTASGYVSHSEGYSTTASGAYSHAEGFRTEASGVSSHAEGGISSASGDNSHAEGRVTTASGPASHVEGIGSVSSGWASHAEGSGTASGDYSHAEGVNTTASGNMSHAEGKDTIAAGVWQHVFGTYNVQDNNNTYIEIVGKGSSNNARSNARTLDWSGNEWLAGGLSLVGNLSAAGANITGTFNTPTVDFYYNGTYKGAIYATSTGLNVQLASGATFTTNINGNATNVTGTVAVSNGGTGGGSRATGMYNLSYMGDGENLISSTSNDTQANWAALGTGYTYFRTTGCLNGQPRQWGFVESIVMGNEVNQIWRTQGTEGIFWRTANGSTTSMPNWTHSSLGLESHIYCSASNWSSYPWYKIAVFTITKTYQDINLKLRVMNGREAGISGILNLRVRSDSTIAYNSAQAIWENAIGIDPSSFVLVNTNSTTVEFWCKMEGRYDGWIFRAIDGGNRSTGQYLNSGWKLNYNTEDGGSASYSSGTVVTSTVVASSWMQRGTVAGSGAISSGSYRDYTVTFPKAFTSAPIVVVGFDSNSTAGEFGRCSCSVSSVSATGCTLRVFNGDSSNRNPSLNWIAVQ